jgi:hypothetical protein
MQGFPANREDSEEERKCRARYQYFVEFAEKGRN